MLSKWGFLGFLVARRPLVLMMKFAGFVPLLEVYVKRDKILCLPDGPE